MAHTRCNAEKDREDKVSSKQAVVIDLNLPNPDAPEEDKADEPINNHDSHIDWSCGSIDIGKDGRLECVNPEPTPQLEGHELAAAVHQAAEEEDAHRFSSYVQNNDEDLDTEENAISPLWTFFK
ncbi:hypothetical protein KC19_9G151800 [Ceratodon purpureus]|uniref:Uncharacterized protein n=1 Tax=Ceratodon purpureus TaxID=3225 RepID=A0A8T0GVQ7_CERPU|nr:hypothetical protein KC19_9G151800 [Ceratodon purpureus]